MSITKYFAMSFASLLVLVVSTASADAYDESIDGDFSGDGALPTVVAVLPGINTISGIMGTADGEPSDRDFFTFEIPTGYQLTSINFTELEALDGGNFGGGVFFAIDEGSTIDTGFSASHASNALIDNTGEWLDDLTAAPEYAGNATGLDAPVGPGDYTIWFQESAAKVSYSMQLGVAVPEPATLQIGLMSVMLVAGRFRRRRNR